MKIKFTRNILPAVVLTLSIGLFSCGDKKSQGGAGMSPQGAKAYKVLEIQPQEFTAYADFPATIEGEENVEIRPKIDGYIERIFVDEGAVVRKGQVLFKISAPQYEQEVRTARANIQIAQANVNAAEMEVNKVRPLVEKNIISKYELETAEFNLQSRQAALAQAKATLANANTNIGYTSVISPVNGVVGSLPYKIGSLVNSNTAMPLTTVSNINNIYAYFSINEKMALEFAKDTKGATSKLRLATMPPVTLILANGDVFSERGKVEATSGMINTQTGALSVRATFRNPGNLIRSGSSGLIRIPTTLDKALLIPQRATYEIQGKKFVFVVKDSGKVESTLISIRNNSNGQVFVVEKGLKPGDLIVLEGVATLREGEIIKPVKANEDSLYNEMKSSSPTDSSAHVDSVDNGEI